jgi:hypothetical protein
VGVKRFRRWLLNGLTAVSLVVCVAMGALWARSWHKGQSIERVDPDRRIVVTSMYGLITASRWDGVFEPTLGTGFERNHAPRGTWQKWMYWHGREFGDTGPTDWAYEPFCGSDRWWQMLGFDGCDLQLKPRRGAALHDWLQPQWSGRVRGLTLPYWAVVLVFSVLPMISLLRLVQRFRHSRAGLCPACGYDLRATPERCPECGTVAKVSD